ncbi:gfo/Idh/MocA family oxidoreductase [Roseibium polysiphoniae]|uniref:Gfo/Idh/MocA family oxidoreductase n=1 Tax=Roseibium polysiphoniae TaxID=2571221 RepID=A0A944CAU8_9HYPH|nr:Gfo/Idh/MocA family oxidoreductase [Roseibium polysiphoniae]MBS8259122.1 gfo/Idh/MocA family oxidoreductase [Roseibium polysiphoniae]
MTIESTGKTGHSGAIRLGMVGGGQGAFIGGVHRIASRIDGDYQLVAGALSSDAERSKASGAELGLAPERCYADFNEMAQAEAARADGIEAVAIVTPNHMHFPVAKAFLEAGIHVICDKPLTSTLKDAEALAEVAGNAGRLFVLTHNYSGYPMIRQAREMVQSGTLGAIRLVQMEYVQDWLTEDLESTGQKQASWRTDPARSGAGGCIGDIGTHAYQLGGFVSGLKTDTVLADLTSFVPGRRVDDNVSVLLRFEGGAKGMLWASQVAPGNENGLSLRIYGDKGGLEWHQEQPNHLWYTPFGEPKRLITRGGSGATPAAERVTRVPAGHPEGYLEGFATIYREAAEAIRAARTGASISKDVQFPGIADGLNGMRFIDACIRSSNEGAVWTKV